MTSTPQTATAREEVLAIVEHFGLPLDHPPAVLAEAEAWLASPGLDDPALLDLEAIPFVTIDNEDSRDLDQALHLEALPDGGHLVRYALADASYYVRPGSALHAEALSRGASYYLPGLVLPMLPVALSEGLVSLNEGVARRSLVFLIALDAAGEVRSVELVRARIRSRAKLSYAGVQRLWDGDPHLENRDFTPSLFALRVVGQRRVALAEARGVVQHPRIEVDVGFTDAEGRAFIAFEAKRHETDRANEQISLLVNVEGAKLLAERSSDPRLLAIFRVHPAPGEDQLSAFAELSRRLVAAHDLPDALGWDGVSPLAAYLRELERALGRHPVALALQRQALLINQRSMFAAAPGLHHGVGAPCYARFSSPMREIVGVHTHKEALELLGLVPERHDDPELREAVIAAANASKDRQGQLTKAANQRAIEALLAPDAALEPRPERPGTVLGVGPDKAYVLLDDPPLEVKVYARDLAPRWRSDELALHLEPAPPGLDRLTLGDRVRLIVRRYDAGRERVVLEVTAKEPAGAPRPG